MCDKHILETTNMKDEIQRVSIVLQNWSFMHKFVEIVYDLWLYSGYKFKTHRYIFMISNTQTVRNFSQCTRVEMFQSAFNFCTEEKLCDNYTLSSWCCGFSSNENWSSL